MPLAHCILRCVPVLTGFALFASAAVAFPLSTAAEQRARKAQAAPLAHHAIIRKDAVAGDEAAVLEFLRAGLTRVADGSTYAWHGLGGRLSGTVKPTATFRRVDGGLCRHLIVEVTRGETTRRAEGVACRMPDGAWRLEG
jgi:surface antigen